MDKTIVQCAISKGKFVNVIAVVYDDGTRDDRFGSYYPDELYYSEQDFVGLTKRMADLMMQSRDKAYLRS